MFLSGKATEGPGNGLKYKKAVAEKATLESFLEEGPGPDHSLGCQDGEVKLNEGLEKPTEEQVKDEKCTTESVRGNDKIDTQEGLEDDVERQREWNGKQREDHEAQTGEKKDSTPEEGDKSEGLQSHGETGRKPSGEESGEVCFCCIQGLLYLLLLDCSQ